VGQADGRKTGSEQHAPPGRQAEKEGQGMSRRIGNETMASDPFPDSRSKDILGRVYEYFLGRFAAAEGKAGGEFYTPQSVVKLLVEMIEPYKGRVFDTCCGSGGIGVWPSGMPFRLPSPRGGRMGSLPSM
jgi:hypothetical protein